MTNKELVAELQGLGVEDINPNATKSQLEEMLSKAKDAKGIVEAEEANEEQPSGPMSDMDKIMAAITGVATSVNAIEKRVNRIEEGGKNDFMNEVKESDIESANKSKSSADPRVVAIVEETLGIDFGVEVEPNPNNPGFQFTILVPQRLSPIPGASRPVIDPETGSYMKDVKTEMVIEENYWPGDRRSRAIGSTDSFDIIRDHCNKVRAHIVTYYEKLKKPLPEFKLRG
jgi:hypothetical protein